MGGPGETQIETDRRLIADKIGKLKRELEEVRRTRTLQRSARKRVPYPTVALVGYTNAGKSTLFNRLTQSEVRGRGHAVRHPGSDAARHLKLPDGRPAILSDTVGFISDLPHELVEAFRATLEEVQRGRRGPARARHRQRRQRRPGRRRETVLDRLGGDMESARIRSRSGTRSTCCRRGRPRRRSHATRSAPSRRRSGLRGDRGGCARRCCAAVAGPGRRGAAGGRSRRPGRAGAWPGSIATAG